MHVGIRAAGCEVPGTVDSLARFATAGLTSLAIFYGSNMYRRGSQRPNDLIWFQHVQALPRVQGCSPASRRERCRDGEETGGCACNADPAELHTQRSRRGSCGQTPPETVTVDINALRQSPTTATNQIRFRSGHARTVVLRLRARCEIAARPCSLLGGGALSSCC